MTVGVLPGQERDMEALRLRLAEAEETLRALRAGEVDSFVVETAVGPRIYALEEVGRSYRVLIESMNEGAATLTDTGTIAYCNRRFAEMLAEPLERVMGTPLEDRVVSGERRSFDALLRSGWEGSARGEVSMRRSDGLVVRVQLSMSVVAESEPVLCVVATDLTEQIRLRELREADQHKNEFLGMLSHELRNPLAPIRNSIFVLDRVNPASEAAARARAVIKRQVEHLTRIVDDLLDVTRIARGKIELRRSRIDLRELVTRAAADYYSEMKVREISLRTLVPSRPLWGDVDPTRVSQALGNLLQNAAKFSNCGDEVFLSLEAVGEEAEIRVHDTGAGIDPAVLPHVFDAFVQGDHTIARTEGGLGLGLALVKGIVELHGGTVGVASEGVGHGAEFVVRLPLTTTPSVDAVRPASELNVRGCRVLIVDDNRDSADSLADLVQMLGHTVEVAYDGPGAIEKARIARPDVVMCDIGLPGMNGYAVAQELRRTGHKMRLLAITGYAQPQDVELAIEAGFDGHVAKPLDPDILQRLLE